MLFILRQHVNPLSSFFESLSVLPSPEELFNCPEQPIHLDIGCARGKFLLNLAQLQPTSNFLGLEIRETLVNAAKKDVEELALENLRFLFCNANVSLENWLSNIPSELLQMVSIQFPDPWFKRRHRKRRILQPELLHTLIENMHCGSQLFIQGDVLSIIKEMVDLIESTKCFSRIPEDKNLWLNINPFPIPTERESYVIAQKKNIFRVLYIRNQKNLVI